MAWWSSFKAPDLKSGDPKFKSCSGNWLDLSQVIPGPTPWLHLYIANWSASCQLGFLNSSVHLMYLAAICIAGPHQPMAANYQISALFTNGVLYTQQGDIHRNPNPNLGPVVQSPIKQILD